MRILLLSNSPQIGGGNRSLLLLANGLKQRGHEPTIVVPEEGPMASAAAEQSLKVEVERTVQPSLRSPLATFASCGRWRSLLAHKSSDIVHANDIMTARSIRMAANSKNIPVLCHVRFPAGRELVEWAFRYLPKPAAFIFNSHALRAECGPDIERACPTSRQYVVHNAVDLKQFVPRLRYSGRPRVGILANLIPVKGHHDFLQMAAALHERGTAAEYWIIGEDIHQTGYRAELETTVQRLGLQDCVQFLGHRCDVAQLLPQLDVLVCSSHMETFGRCLIEAMACELPVVATRVGGIPEVVEDGVTGLLVPSKSPGELADAVERLLRDATLRQTMGRAGRQRAETLFSTDSHLTAILDVYGEVKA